jgi:cytoskeletal protein CcmA (bactofilin family)
MAERENKTSHFRGPGGVNVFLGTGTKVTGKLVFEGTARIEGQVEGEISAQDTLTIGESAVVNAKISGIAIIIEGRVTGNVTARQRLELRVSSRVEGSVNTPRLVVHDGALLEGECTMRGAEATALGETATAQSAVTGPVSLASDPSVQLISQLTSRFSR